MLKGANLKGGGGGSVPPIDQPPQFNAVKLYIENCILISFICSVFLFGLFVGVLL